MKEQTGQVRPVSQLLHLFLLRGVQWEFLDFYHMNNAQNPESFPWSL